MNRTLRQLSAKLHLYLGLLSGVVVFIVCLTGSLYSFKDEIIALSQPWRFVEAQERPFLLPSEIVEALGGGHPSSITFGEATDAVSATYFNRDGSRTVYMNPYSGTIIKTVERNGNTFDFFDFVMQGHRSLWLPRPVGRPVVGYGVLIFLICLVTGIILWYPGRRNKKTMKRLFTIRFRAPFSRVNFDLHNVLGGYACLFLAVMAFTGLVRSLPWFSEGVYRLTSGGRPLQAYTLPRSEPESKPEITEYPPDKLYMQLKVSCPEAKSFYFAFPRDESGCIRVSVSHKRGMYYTYIDNLFFDQYTLQPLQGSGPYAGKYSELSTADKFRRMNLDIHDGRILGIFGKIIAFIAGLIGASLPVTGFIIWNQRRKVKRQ
ncbi:MAG: PepSY domain-containing protein [Tannerella sp.]|jgi:uncharacterized iron-regulated membrane protein|nr:PepSY domain-containing protein [Tannerella sp.]